MTLEELKNIQESLPTLTDRLQTWKKIIVELDSKEKFEFNKAISLLESSNDLELIKNSLLSCKEFIDNYKHLFELLLKRLEIPIRAYSGAIDQIEFGDFIIELKNCRKESDATNEKKCIDLVNKYYKDWFPAKIKNPQLTKKQYVNQAKGFVWPVYFQPLYIKLDCKRKRELFNDVFGDWESKKFVDMFFEKIDEAFINI